MSDQAIKKYREHNKKIFNAEKKFYKEDIEFAFSNKSTIYNSIEHGISILDGDLNIKSLNFTLRSWYPNKKNFLDKKCFYVFHSRKEPCDNCPIVKTLNDGYAHCDIVAYHMRFNNTSGWHELQSFPIMDQGKIVGIVEYVKDITREVNLYSKIYDIERKMGGFKEQNEILKTYMTQIEKEKSQISTDISNNIRKYVKPLIKQIKSNCRDRDLDFDLISLLDSLLENIATPYMDESAALDGFTSQEIQVMTMIKEGRTSKEIAEAMSLSIKTVDFHRANIRKKLGLERTDNLRSYLIRSFVAL